MITIRYKDKSDGTKSIYLDITHNGQRRRETLKGLILTGNRDQDRLTMQIVEDIKAKRRLQLVSAEYDLDGIYAREELFLPFYREQATKHKMVKRHNVEGIINEISPGLRFKDITKEWGERFIAWMREPRIMRVGKLQPYSEATIYSCLSTIKTILNIAVEKGIITRNPLMAVKMKRFRPVKVFLTFEEIQTLSDTPCEYPEVKRAFLFACFTGLRLGDVQALKYTNIREGEIVTQQGKTKGIVTIPITPTVRDLLEVATLHHSGKVFQLPSRPTMHAVLKNWVMMSGIGKKVSFHTSRHTFATMLVYYSKDIFTASKLLGHTDVKVTQVYAKLIDDAKVTAMNSLPALSKKSS